MCKGIKNKRNMAHAQAQIMKYPFNNFYSYNDELYCPSFPKEWATDHAPNTGPDECSTCKRVGFWNGVFIGYCVKCADEEYNFNRGVGFVSIGKELTYTNYYRIQHHKKKPIGIDRTTFVLNSAFNTYLKDVNPDNVGDKEFCDSASMVNAEYDKQKLYPNFIITEKEKKSMRKRINLQ